MSNSFAIETTGLTRQFEEVVAVDAVDLAVPRGSVYGFLGPNGAGKSTTIRMLLGLLRPSAGSISIFGRPFPRHRRTQLRRVGAMVEAPSVYQHLTGRENLVVTARLRGGIDAAMIDRALVCVDLLHAADRCVRAYSLGMTQRLGIALALLDDPDLLILDEPTNGLDPAGMHDIRTLIRNLPEQAVGSRSSSPVTSSMKSNASRPTLASSAAVVSSFREARTPSAIGARLKSS